MSINRSGFIETNFGLEIDKDVEARLSYTFNWSDWLDSGDTISTVQYSVAARRNDPAPLIIESLGRTDSNTDTFVELSGGQVDKTYIVTCKITTANGLIDRRRFRVNVKARSA